MGSALLTAEEAAARLGICERTLRELRKKGDIGYVAVTPSRFRYTEEDCDAFIESRRRKDETCPSAKTPARRIGNTTSSSRNGGFMARLAAQGSGTRSATKTR